MKESVHFVKLESKKSTAAWETEEKVYLTREKVCAFGQRPFVC